MNDSAQTTQNSKDKTVQIIIEDTEPKQGCMSPEEELAMARAAIASSKDSNKN
jgi:hypothetical protein